MGPHGVRIVCDFSPRLLVVIPGEELTIGGVRNAMATVGTHLLWQNVSPLSCLT